ncbi:MAG: DMT family transporter [Patescibacteria group bacterium]
MVGFLYGIAAAFFWSLTNIIDKYLTNKHAEDGNVWGLVIASTVFPLILLPIAVTLSPITFELPTTTLLMFTGLLMSAWVFLYLKALTEDEASVVMTLLVLAPLFSLLFSNFILGESLTAAQLLAGAFLILGSLIVSYSGGTGFNFKLIFYAISASAITGLLYTIFKFSSLENEFWNSMFWRSVGMALTGLALCVLIPSIRHRFYQFIKEHFFKSTTLNATNESLTLIGDTFFGFAVLLAPIALVQTTEAYQPIFIIIIGFVLSQIGFETIEEDYSKSTLVRKIMGITCVLIGSAILVL